MSNGKYTEEEFVKAGVSRRSPGCYKQDLWPAKAIGTRLSGPIFVDAPSLEDYIPVATKFS